MRIIALFIVCALLTVRLGGFSEEIFVTPIEDNLFGIAFIAEAGDGVHKPSVLAKSQIALDWDVAPGHFDLPLISRASLVLQPAPYCQKDLPGIYREIFIPPEMIS